MGWVVGMARAWVIHDSSGYEGLSLIEQKEETPQAGEVRLKIEAFALNWGDADLMLDMYSFSFPTFPARIGMEAVGIVDMVGADVTGIEVGERYCTLPYFYYNQGTSADSAVVDARYITKAPKGLSAVESTSVWMQYMTAYFPIVELSKAGPEKTFLIPAATSTAGSAAVEIAKLYGATVIGTTRFEYNTEYLKKLGVDHVFVADSGNLADLIQDVTKGKGIDAAFDPIGAGMMNQYSPALAKNATIYFYGFLDAQFPQLPLIDMFQANATFQPYSLFNYVENEEMCEKGKAFVYDALEQGKLKPIIDKVYPMEGYKEAWEYLKSSRSSHGKVVIETGL